MQSLVSEKRKSPVRLSGEEEYTIYKYCIENHCVYQIDAAIEFRVNQDKVAKEINLLKIVIGRTITSYNVKSSVERVVSWQKRLGKLPIAPMETAELEQLRIHKTKSTRQIEDLKVTLSNLEIVYNEAQKEIERLKNTSAQTKLNKIRAILVTQEA